MGGRIDDKMELEYYDEIKDDFMNSYDVYMKTTGLNPFVNWFIHDNDLYMTDEYPVENACHYLAIGSYLIVKDKIKELDNKILNKIKESYELISSGKYDKYFTDKDKKYTKEDIEIIKKSNIF
ncbi:hypothetical protein [uncultured Clostridium sp.]|uniref:hypothetical protein n=2 Tax=Clostridium TaxID=1485 RepID=UPI00272CCAEB|nr:hypothetical protein [uncultured Clostridium sp.]